MYELCVNSRLYHSSCDGSLMEFLREQCGLTSVKNGCSEGVCGACTVICDDRAVRSCRMKLSSVQGKRILTCEGLSPREKEIYAYAFASCGAVQCGFCTPGMVMSAKALLDAKPDPSEKEIKQALKGNLCRCTGYQKIIRAVLVAAQFLRSGDDVPPLLAPDRTGISAPRMDAGPKILGTAVYPDDICLPGMLYGGALRSAYARARVRSIDISAARRLPGVRAVLTAVDIPGARRIGHLQQDYPVLIGVGELVHFRGDALALVAAENRQALTSALAAIRVEYEELPGVFDVEAAADKDAPLVHEEQGDNLLSEVRLSRGDCERAFREAAHLVRQVYTLPPTEHAFLEPETAVARPWQDGVSVYCADQGAYQTRRECAAMLGIPETAVRIEEMYTGGGFGGKEDLSVQQHAALLAWYCQAPVKVSLSRAESLLIHPKRHAMCIEATTSCDSEGVLTGFSARIVADGGAYASLSGPVLQRACTHAAGPYRYPNIEISGAAYYTNNPPAGAFRGFGVTQSCFACESNLNLLAEELGISPWEIRMKNALNPGNTMPNGQIAADDTAIKETLEAVRPYYESHPGCGIACALKNSGVGVGIRDTGRCTLRVQDGVVHIYSAASCIGQGLATVLTQIVAEVSGLSGRFLRYHRPATDDSPDSGNTTASRQTLFAGEAARRAALDLRQALDCSSLSLLEGREFAAEYLGETDPFGSNKEHPVSHVAYSYATHVVSLDEEGRILRVIAAHDVGTAINPLNVEGQIEGGVVMSLGYSLTEDFPLAEGQPQARYGTLGLWRSTDIPQITPVIVTNPAKDLATRPAFGAKGVGEIAAIPTAPAVSHAYFRRDKQFRTQLPLKNTPYQRKK